MDEVVENVRRVRFVGDLEPSGHVTPDRKNETKGRLARFAGKRGRRVTVTVETYVKDKTHPQLGLYFREHGLLHCWAEYIGDDMEAVHKDLKDAFLVPVLLDPVIGNPSLLKRVNKLTGEEKQETPSLADLDVHQMSAYIDRVIREGAKNGIVFDLSEYAA